MSKTLNYKNILKNYKKTRLYKLLRNKPFTVAGGLFTIIIILIIAGQVLTRLNRDNGHTEPTPKQVSVYHVGEAPTIKVLATVTKENVWQVVAQTGGIFQNSYVKEGDAVYTGKTLAYISSNYQGASAGVIQAQIAKKSWENTQDTYQTQLDIIKNQRELAEKQDINADQLRDIQELSLDSTRNQINLSKEVLDELNTQLENLEQLQASSPSAATQTSITTLKSQKLQLMGGLSQLENALRSTEYQVDGDNPPAAMSNLSKDMTLKQLELQEKGLTLSKEISELNYKLAQVNASLAYPTSICNGVVQKVHVHRGQMIQPGTVLYTIAIEQGQTFVETKLAPEMVAQLSLIEDSYILVDGQKIAVRPNFIPTEATDGVTHAVKFAVPEESWSLLTNREYVEMELAIGSADTSNTNTYLPIDAIYQTADQDFVFVVENGKVETKTVELGEVYGQLVSIKSGLETDSQVILDRNVIAGERITQ
jgi:multidrug efflux pump subunit AcrA (membrane-fusion protein)